MLSKYIPGLTLSLLLSTTMLLAEGGPTFDVASIKKAEPLSVSAVQSGKMKIGMTIDAAMVNINAMSLTELLRYAYKVKSFQVSGPDFLGAERFDIVAKMPPGSSRDQIPEMIQALLADRFKLTLHRSTIEKPVYALVIAKSGLNLKESATDPAATGATSGGPAAPLAPTPTDGGAQVRASVTSDTSGSINSSSINGDMKMVPGDNGMRMQLTKMNTTGLVELIGRFVDKPVVDMTDLKGRYDLNLDISFEDMIALGRAAGMSIPVQTSSTAAAEPGSSSIFTAIQPYGLRLEQRKAPIDLLIIDHVEKSPTEN